MDRVSLYLLTCKSKKAQEEKYYVAGDIGELGNIKTIQEIGIKKRLWKRSLRKIRYSNWKEIIKYPGLVIAKNWKFTVTPSISFEDGNSSITIISKRQKFFKVKENREESLKWTAKSLIILIGNRFAILGGKLLFLTNATSTSLFFQKLPAKYLLGVFWNLHKMWYDSKSKGSPPSYPFKVNGILRSMG